MSFWTYIDGSITVRPLGSTQAEKRYVLETVLNHLPQVTGSERNMRIHIVQKYGHNSSSSHNEFDEVMSYRGFGESWMRVQDEYILVLEAALRDREFEQTKREFVKWLNRLAKRVGVHDILVRVTGYERRMIISDAEPYREMEERPSWTEESGGEPAWAEYLLWDSAKNMRYPMKLAYKYYDDPDNDAEVERRMRYDRE